MYHNVEKSAFRKGQYTGYAIGKVWRIWRDRSTDFWYATSEGRVIQAFTLRDLSKKLEALTPLDALPNPFAA